MNEKHKIDFTTFVLSISSAAFMGMGLTPKPNEGAASLDLDLAKHNIDLLDLLREKTKNNLTPEESRLLEGLLFETRMKFLEVQKNNSSTKT